MNEEQVLELFKQVSNWSRWGKDDQRGTLNYITPEVIRRATAGIRDGHTVSCGLPVNTTASIDNHNPAQWRMVVGSEQAPETGFGASTDFLGIAAHGSTHTHLDALCHVFFNRRMYNDRPASLVTSAGAKANSVTVAHDGIVSRGVLLDIAALRGVEFIEPDQPVHRADLEAAEEHFGVRVREGDVVLVRFARQVRKRIKGPECEKLNGGVHLPGMHPDCLGWFHERKISLLGSDAGQDVLPPMFKMRSPIHAGALVYMGLHLLDHASLEDLAEACRARKRWDFFFMIAPLRIDGGTCSPVNPIAIF